MKKIILALCLCVLAFPISSRAASVNLSWDASPGATSYKIQMSTDLGVTWPVEKVVPTGTTFIWAEAPDTGLLLFRAISIGAQGQTIRTDAGVWYNGAWKPPSLSSGLGIQ